jgi:hypothetical protein
VVECDFEVGARERGFGRFGVLMLSAGFSQIVKKSLLA